MIFYSKAKMFFFLKFFTSTPIFPIVVIHKLFLDQKGREAVVNIYIPDYDNANFVLYRREANHQKEEFYKYGKLSTRKMAFVGKRTCIVLFYCSSTILNGYAKQA